MNLNNLNDDCLECIFQFLPLEEQLSLALVSPQFLNVLSSMWIRKHVKHGKLTSTDNIEMISFERQKEGLEAFASVVCERTEELSVTKPAALNLLLKRKWPNLQILKARVDFNSESENVQFSDEHFPALTNLSIVWDVTEARYTTQLVRRLRETGSVFKYRYDVDELEGFLNRMREYQRYRNEPDIGLDRIKCSRREIKRYSDRIKNYMDNYMWTHKFDTLKGNLRQNPRILKVSGFDARVLGLDLMPQLQELHFRNPLYERTIDENKAIYEFLAYVTNCVKFQLRAKTRLLPLEVFFCYSTDCLSPPFKAYSKIPKWLRFTGDPLPVNYEYFEVMPFYFKLECEY